MPPNLNSVFQELDTVALTHDVPEQGLHQGDVGAIVHCYPNGVAFEVEFLTNDGQTIALTTLISSDVRLVQPHSS